ncbi:MAG: metallopeptidase TldD-related protein [Chloroflexota bacterium]
MENILDAAKRVSDSAEIYIVTSEETPVQFEANRLKNIQSKESSQIALRILKSGKVGYATTTGPEAGEKLLENALETARFGITAGFEFPARVTYPDVKVFDPNTASFPLEGMIKICGGLVSQIKAHTPDIMCAATVRKATVAVRMMNSNGGEAGYRLSAFSIGVEGTLVRGTDMLFVGDSESSCHPIPETKKIAENVIRQLELAKNQASVTTGSLPVIFTPDGVASALIPSLISAFNGKTVLQGASPLIGRLGETVFDRKLNLVDDPTRPYHPCSRPCDDEAVPSQQTPLIESGVVRNFLYDLQTAALAHTRSTSNGARGRSGQPAPSPGTFAIAADKTPFNDMIQDIKEGLLVEQLMGAAQGNILNGDFSGNVLLGYKIENGRITGRVKDTIVAGNVFQLLKDIAAIGSDSKWVGSFLHTPSLYFPGLSVATKP